MSWLRRELYARRSAAILDKAIIFGADSHKPSLGQRTGGLHACALADQFHFRRRRSISLRHKHGGRVSGTQAGWSISLPHPKTPRIADAICRGWRASFVEKMFRCWRVAGSRKASFPRSIA